MSQRVIEDFCETGQNTFYVYNTIALGTHADCSCHWALHVRLVVARGRSPSDVPRTLAG